MSKPTLDGLKATYSAKGTGGVFVTVEGLLVRLVSTTGQVCIGVDQWDATKNMVDGAIAHYQAIDTKEEVNDDE